MFKILFILFLTVPLIEIYILIQVGSLIGPMPTVAMVVLTAIIGAYLLRYQGLQTIARVQEKMARGEVPATDMLEGMILLVSGAFLLTPGFFTDAIGFLCLIPSFRTHLASGFLNQLFQRGTHSSAHQTFTMDGEYWEENNKQIND